MLLALRSKLISRGGVSTLTTRSDGTSAFFVSLPVHLLQLRLSIRPFLGTPLSLPENNLDAIQSNLTLIFVQV